MENVTPLSTKAYTPEFVLESLKSKVSQIKQLYVMAYDDNNIPTIYLIGNLRGAKNAVFDFQRAVLDKSEDMQGRTWE